MRVVTQAVLAHAHQQGVPRRYTPADELDGGAHPGVRGWLTRRVFGLSCTGKRRKSSGWLGVVPTGACVGVKAR